MDAVARRRFSADFGGCAIRVTAIDVGDIHALPISADSCLREMTSDQPTAWVRRIDRDLADVLYLTDRSVRSGLWCAASTAKRPALRTKLEPIMQRIAIAASVPPASIAAETSDRLRTVVDGLPFWRP